MIRHSKDGYCISLPFVVKCSCKPPEKTTTLLPPVITTDNNLITAHRIGWIIWTHQIIKKMRYQIYEAKSVKHDAQQRGRIVHEFYGTIYANKENGKLESNKRMWLYEKIHISILGNRVSVTYSKEV